MKTWHKSLFGKTNIICYGVVLLAFVSATAACSDGDALCRRIKGERAFCLSNDAARRDGKGGASRELPLAKGTRRFGTIRKGETITLVDIDGPGRIESFWMATVIKARLRIWWDREENPSVDVPVADFFCFTYPDATFDEKGEFTFVDSDRVMVAPHRSLNCWWRMPFRRHCKITLTSEENDCLFPYHCIGGVYAPVSDDELYFHAKFNEANPVSAGLYTPLEVHGEGRFVGLSFGAEVVLPPRYGEECFCEGPIKVYADDRENPVYGYTGTEDYFCGSYSWGAFAPTVSADRQRYRSFTGRYAGFRALPGVTATSERRARFRMYRLHVHDSIPFESYFRMTFQNFSLSGDKLTMRRDNVRSVAFWYQAH